MRIPKLSIYQYFIILFLFSVSVYVLGVLRVKSIFWGDSLYYYAYTRSIVVDHDIDFSNQSYHSVLGFPNPVEFSPVTGKITNKFSPGTAVFWIPGFVIGHVLSYLGNIVGHILGFLSLEQQWFLTDGNGILSQFFVAISALLYSILGIWFLFKTLQVWFTTKTSTVAAALLFFCTQLFYYTTMDPVNSHSVSFFLSSFLLYQFSTVLKTKSTWKNVIPMGITAGCLILVRNQDIVVIVPVLLALLFAETESIMNRLNWITLYLGSAFVIFSIQIYVTLTLFGVLGSPYLIRGESLNWFNPDFFRVLFSLENGLFFFAPILCVSFIFLTKHIVQNFNIIRSSQLLKSNSLLVLVTVSFVSFLLQLYVVASWGPEIIGGPYGTRMFMSVLPQLGIGTALFVQYLDKRLSKKRFVFAFSMITLLLFTNMFLQTIYMLYRY